jgi:hypothetical protein
LPLTELAEWWNFAQISVVIHKAVTDSERFKISAKPMTLAVARYSMKKWIEICVSSRKK